MITQNVDRQVAVSFLGCVVLRIIEEKTLNCGNQHSGFQFR